MGIARFGTVAVAAHAIKIIRVGTTNGPLEMVDHENKVHALSGTKGGELEEAIKVWTDALANKPQKAAKKPAGKKKAAAKKKTSARSG